MQIKYVLEYTLLSMLYEHMISHTQNKFYSAGLSTMCAHFAAHILKRVIKCTHSGFVGCTLKLFEVSHDGPCSLKFRSLSVSDLYNVW